MIKVRQKKDGWCGPATLQYALGMQGFKASQERLARITGTTVKKGVDPIGIVKGANKLGFKTNIIKNKSPRATLNKLNSAVKSGKSVIIDYLQGSEIKRDGHYASLIGVTPNRVRVFDPSKGKVQSLHKDRFISRWQDITSSGRKFKNLGIIITKVTK